MANLVLVSLGLSSTNDPKFMPKLRRSSLKSVRALLNPGDDPILKEVLKEPIAFFGGVFAGLLRLDLNEEPLREWVARTSEAAGLDLSESPSADDDDSIPEDIQID
ncbi:unnamed protein product [Sphagnum troendelagicum]